MATPTVVLSRVSKTFGPTVALSNCNLTAYAGEVHAIIGGNGSGKSTLAKVVSGVIRPDTGQVSVFGKVATTPVEARRIGIANVFQEVMVADGCSVIDNLFLGSDGLFTATANREEKLRRAGSLMHELLGFQLDLSTPVGDLPLSLKQWITIARAMLGEPKLLILDESSAALDFEATERLFRKLRELRTAGMSIMIVTHRIAELVRVADRATVLRGGSDVGCLEREEITERRILDLIAGAQNDDAGSEAPLPVAQSEHPLIRVKAARIWSDSPEFDFTLHAGEIVGVVGLDGQGQSDFVRAIAGVAPMANGTINVVGDRSAHAVTDLRSARRYGLSYVSGDRKKEGIFPNLSIFENLLMTVYPEYRAGGILNLINRTKLGPIFDWESGQLRVRMGNRNNSITSLSGGNQQKVLIARAFAEKPRVLVLNDPARGIDVGAKRDLYANLKAFASQRRSVLYLSSEVEEFIDLCTRVLVFRGGAVTTEFAPPFDGNAILNAMFGRKVRPAATAADLPPSQASTSFSRFENGRPVPRSVKTVPESISNANDGTFPSPPPGSFTRGTLENFTLESPSIGPDLVVPPQFAEDVSVSPALVWAGVPAGTRSFALAVTDPDLPEEFAFPRAFAHWLVVDIPARVRRLDEGVSKSAQMPPGTTELNSDFVTMGIPGFGRGYSGPWPPDRAHRYVFTLFALKIERVALEPDADLGAFYAAVMPATIASASFVALYGPARKPLPASVEFN